MLPLMLTLMLVADPLTAPPTPPPAAPGVRIIDADADAAMADALQSLETAQRHCRNGELHQAGEGAVVGQRSPRVAGSDLMFRQGDPVSLTLLLERRVGQCSVPISTDLTAPDGRLPSFPARAD